MQRNSHENVEKLAAACILSMLGGFLDIYTYLCRGGVFANAVTGNMVLWALSMAEGKHAQGIRCVAAILAYATGVLVVECLRRKFAGKQKNTWYHFVLGLEAVCLAGVFFIPYGRMDAVATMMISFVCAIQIQAFRRVRGLPFSSTMCTGNLRSGTEALVAGFREKKTEEFNKAWHYYGVIFCFITGAIIGAALILNFGRGVFLLAPLALIGVFLLISNRYEFRAIWRRFKKPNSRQ